MPATRHLLRSFRLLQNLPKPSTAQFHSTPAIMVKAGDSIPDVDLFEDSPGNKVNLAKELSTGKGLIIGVPAAFSKSLYAETQQI